MHPPPQMSHVKCNILVHISKPPLYCGDKKWFPLIEHSAERNYHPLVKIHQLIGFKDPQMLSPCVWSCEGDCWLPSRITYKG